MVIGASATVVIHGLVAGIIVFLSLSSAGGKTMDSSAKPINFIAARLVRQGKPPDPKKLPDRIVPALPTAPPKTIPLDQNEAKAPPPQKPKEEAQPDAVKDDKLRKVFNRARAFGEVTDNNVEEGSPDGVPEGEVTDPNEAALGDLYATRLYRLFKDRWVVPTLIAEKELDKMSCQVVIQLDADLSIHKFQIFKSSGNQLFDDSVLNAIQRVRDEVRKLPEPPSEIAPILFSAGMVLRFHGKDASKN